MAANQPLAVSVRAQQHTHTHILKMIGAGPLASQKQNLIIATYVADLAVRGCHADFLSGQLACKGFLEKGLAKVGELIDLEAIVSAYTL